MIDTILQHLASLPKEEANWGFLGGVLSSSSDEQREKWLSEVRKREDLGYGYTLLLKALRVTSADLKILSKRASRGELTDVDLGNVRFAVTDASDEEVGRFALHVLEAQPELKQDLFLLIETYVRNQEHNNLQHVERELIREGLLMPFLRERRSRLYPWQQAATRLLREKRDEELALALTSQIIEVARDEGPASSVGLGDELRDVIRILLREYYETVWPRFSEVLLEGASGSLAMMEIIAKSPFGSFREETEGGTFFQEVPIESIVEWADDHRPRAPVMIARLAPVFEKNAERQSEEAAGKTKVVWHPIMQRLIDEFEDVEGFLQEVGSNLFSFGSTGSRVPYYRTRIELLETLSDHESQRVRNWAREGVKRCEAYIEEELKEEEERRVRYGP